MDDALSLLLSQNLRVVREQIAAACRLAGRTESEVKLVAVTKYVDNATVIALARCLAEDHATRLDDSPIILGENRPQVLQQRWSEWPEALAVDWHLIGHLQSNKIKVVVGRTALIHSLDRFELLDKLNEQAARHNLVVRGLLEFRLSDDSEKHGFVAADLPRLLDRWAAWSNLQLCGVMGMSGLDANETESRRQFEMLREIFNRMGEGLTPDAARCWQELSMGMSGDLPQAIAAGATMVRIGSALFRGLLN